MTIALSEVESAPVRRASVLATVATAMATRPMLFFGLAIFVLIMATAVFAPALSGHDPLDINPASRLRPPAADHWFGTDGLGRDIFSRTLHGGRVSLMVGFGVALTSGAAGLVLGLISGYFSRLDWIIGRTMDALMAIPAILIAVMLIALTKPSIAAVITVISVPEIPRVVRLIRSVVLTLRKEGFVEASIVSGSRPTKVIIRHVLPHVIAPLVVQATFAFSFAVMIEAAMSFLGVGIPPEHSSWGGIVSDGRAFYARAPWIVAFPGIFLFMTVLSVNLIGDALRDLNDPRGSRREAGSGGSL